MTPLILAGMALVFLSFAAVLTAAESAFNYLPRHDAEQAVLHSRGTSLKRIMAQPVAHMRALRFWRVWFEMAAAVAVTVLLHSLLDNVWLAGLIATGIMALRRLRDRRGVPAAARPGALRRRWSASAPRWSGCLYAVLGPIPGWLVRLGSAVAPARRPTTRRSSAKRNSANSWTAPPSPT